VSDVGFEPTPGRGGASVFFSRLPAEVQRNFRQLSKRLMNRFGKRDPPTTVRRRIKELCQDKEETLEAYVDRTRELALDGYPDASEAVIEAMAADAFLVGCSNKDAFLVGCSNKDAVFQALQQRPETVDKALELVREATHNHRATYGPMKKKDSELECHKHS
jgi:hypothetical protein